MLYIAILSLHWTSHFLSTVIQCIIITTGCLPCKTKGRYSYQMCAASQQLDARGCLTFPDQRGAVLDVYIYIYIYIYLHSGS